MKTTIDPYFDYEDVRLGILYMVSLAHRWARENDPEDSIAAEVNAKLSRPDCELPAGLLLHLAAELSGKMRRQMLVTTGDLPVSARDMFAPEGDRDGSRRAFADVVMTPTLPAKRQVINRALHDYGPVHMVCTAAECIAMTIETWGFDAVRTLDQLAYNLAAELIRTLEDNE